MTELLLHGDCLERLRELDDNSIDSCVSDPPYGLSKEPNISEVLSEWISGNDEYVPDGKGFMSKEWDGFVPPPAIWREVYRVLKPGGHALVFSGTRTQDLMTISLRLAGFEVRDVIEWLYFSGFPKSHNTHNIFKRRYRCELENTSVNLVEASSSQNGGVKETDGLDSVPEVVLDVVNGEVLIERANNAERNFTLRGHIRNAKAEGIKALFAITNVRQSGKDSLQAKVIRIGKAAGSLEKTDISLLTSEESTDWSTLSSLKKRLEGESEATKTSITLTELRQIIDLKILNFLQKVNTLDAIATQNHTALKPAHEPIIVVRKPLVDADTGRKLTVVDCVEKYGTGAINIDASRIALGDERAPTGSGRFTGVGNTYGYKDYVNSNGGNVTPKEGRFPANCITVEPDAFYSKYFNVTPQELSKKASKKDRNSDWQGEEIEIGEKVTTDGRKKPIDNAYNRGMTTRKNSHPTVKPTDLMAWLVRLVTPSGGTVLDPFAGSGSTLVAAKREGFGFVGIELTDEYIPIIEARTGTEVEG